MAASSSFINNFLFKHEKVGGPWYGNIDSLILPFEFRFVALSMVLMMSVIHHIGYRVVILGPVSRWIHEKVGWTDIYSCCSCCRRRRKSGYRRLDSLQERDSMNLNDSVLSADESDSPAAEWEARRTFGKWRAPAPVQYKWSLVQIRFTIINCTMPVDVILRYEWYLIYCYLKMKAYSVSVRCGDVLLYFIDFLLFHISRTS